MTAPDSRLSRLAQALAVVVSRPPVAVASTALKLRNPLNGSGGTTKGARYAANARRKSERTRGALLALRLAKPHCDVVVVLTRISPKPFDDDNLAAAFKSCRDGMAEAWGIDDADPRVTWVYDWRKGAKDAVEAALWVLPSEWVPQPHADSPTLRLRKSALTSEWKTGNPGGSPLVGPPMPPPGRVIQDFDASDYERPRREARVTPNVIRAKGGA